MQKHILRGSLLGGLVAFLASATLATAAISIQWGRPTQAERDAKELKCVLHGANGHSAEILVYVSGMEAGRTYEIEVEVKEKAADATGEEQKLLLEVEDLVSTPVPVLPPPDSRD